MTEKKRNTSVVEVTLIRNYAFKQDFMSGSTKSPDSETDPQTEVADDF
jgi:hypothetical protein